ncbi:glycoside hydrolase family 3 C-terminal domain-containing protein [Maribellus sp. YY47]|uniref:glycoside hydrolase family 3 C-terminal domain-containing protein n=1 Tax=Maribellus sp. YY47 TaxID=2929486 RepID=UPI00200152EB|nr:glycoside hydrolase family 3 C-terminal domain-containing protein [Maribellus sp. YY47]MCK3684709.1 glycoside hydrolase family 3 C-terminal domain-containing protein [Maribellus sp. YY47]
MKLKQPKPILLILFALLTLAFIPQSQMAKKPIYLNTSYSFKERAIDLVSRMTPEEKQSQLGNTMPPIPRLGVNHYDVWGEALHGIMGRNNNSGMTATSFPNSVAVGSTWDPELIKRETKVISDEARGFNHDLIFTLTYWSPVIEPARDPRWGRTAETFGEDPFLVSEIGKGFIQGLMGDDPKYLKTVPCGKHYFANNTEFNRHSGSSDMDDRDMREFYLLPYRTLIRDYDLPAIMTAYGAVNGVPMSASKYLVDTVARKTYGMDGYVTGDCGAIDDIVRGHHFTESYEEAAALGLKAGVDTDCGGVYQNHALNALEKGMLAQADIDKALINIFTIRMRLGEFDPSEIVPYAGIKPEIVNDPSHNDLAIEVATKTPVLLKNEVTVQPAEKALPLNTKHIKKIAVLGPEADKVELGDYSGPIEPHLSISPLLGIQNYIKEHKLDIEVVSASSGNTDRNTDFLTMNSFSTVRNGEVVAEFDATKYDDSAPGLIVAARFGRTSIRGVKDGDWTAYDNVDITDVDSIRFNVAASGNGGLLEVRVSSATGNILATQKIEAVQQSGGFRGFSRPQNVAVKINTLGISGPQTLVLVYREAESPATDQETLEMAATADVVLVFVGTDQTTGREESDRFTITLPGNQDKLIEAVAAENPNTIVVMQTMGMVEVEQFNNNPNIPAIVWTGYNGQTQGTAMARILFGDVNPGGKLNVTWHKSLNDLPGFNDYTLRGDGSNGRTYWYFDKPVSYEFGYGLSYTTFEYNRFSISKTRLTPHDKVTVSVDVKNTGAVDGDEVVQVYVKTPDSQAELERPIKRLKGFKRVTIPAGQTKRVSIDIDCDDLWFWDAEAGKITFDQGRYIFEIGASSKDIKAELETIMSGEYKPVLTTVVAESNKVILRPGNAAQTSVTAAMSDDSFYDISKAEIEYKSNNPAVVSVDENGKITATGVGVASVFAYVTVDGVTVSNSYPVKVMPDLNPRSILVNGKAIESFNKEVKAYSYLLKNKTKVPELEATAAGNGITVDIQQAKQIPGTAVVKFIDNITLETNTYYFNFDLEAVSDEFNGAVGSQWQWIRENTATHSLSANDGSLTITSEIGDVSEGTNNAKNILLQSANNDWTAETKLTASRMPSQPENAGILAYQDDDNFVKLMFRAVIKTTRQREPQPGTIDLMMEENGIAKSLASFNLKNEITGDQSLILKLDKKGSIYTAYYSLDGVNFERLGTADMLLKDIKTGLMVCDGIITGYMKSTFWFDSDTTKPETPFDVSFDYFRITNSGLKQ